MKKTIFPVLLLSLILSPGTFAAHKEIGGKFVIDVPKDWKHAEQLFGIPYMFLGPKKLSKRATLSIIPSENQSIDLTGNLSQESIKSYQEKRKSWISEHSGSLNGFLPYEKMKISKLGDVHRFGMNYRLGNENFTEYSFYFYCGKELIHAKSLSLENDQKGKSDLSAMVNSLGCKK